MPGIAGCLSIAVAVYCCWRVASQWQAGSGLVALRGVAPPTLNTRIKPRPLTCPQTTNPTHPCHQLADQARPEQKCFGKLPESQDTLLLVLERVVQYTVTFCQNGFLNHSCNKATKNAHLEATPQPGLLHQYGRLLNQVSGVLSKKTVTIAECFTLVSPITFYAPAAQCDGKFS